MRDATPLLGPLQAASKRHPVLTFVVPQLAVYAFEAWKASRETARQAA
jgi:hypothetical protein